MSQIPAIPAQDDPEFCAAVSALARSASVMHKAVKLICCAGADPERVLMDHGDVLETSEKVIDTWAAHLGIDD